MACRPIPGAAAISFFRLMNRVFIPVEFAEPPVLDVAAVPQSLSGLTMGTTWSAKLILPAGTVPETLGAGIQRQLDLVVRQMSTWSDDSDLSRFNQAQANTWHEIPVEFFRVLDCALTVAQATGGAYDPSVGPLVNLWGFGPDARHQPTPAAAELAVAQSRCGWQRIRLDRVRCRVWQAGGIYLDFSSIAKGFAVDLAVDYLRAAGIPSYLVEVGGELRGYGVKPDQQPWWVGIEQPLSVQGGAATTADAVHSVVALHGLALATSGDYRRYFEHAGKYYSHTIDPRSAAPIAHPLAAVTVLHPECMVADVWATALMVLGPEEGMRCAQERGLAALFLARDGSGFSESMTPALRAMLT